jgi:hypothetical protein
VVGGVFQRDADGPVSVVSRRAAAPWREQTRLVVNDHDGDLMADQGKQQGQQQGQNQSGNVQAEHGDRRVEELKQKYGDLAEMTVDQLQERARQQGVSSPSSMNKEELLQALTSGGGGGGGGRNSGGGGRNS